MRHFSNDNGTLLALGVVAAVGAASALRRRGSRAGRRYESSEWVDFFTEDKTRPQTRELSERFSEVAGQAYDAWSQGVPELAQSQVDEDEVAYRTYASIAGHGIGLWDGELFDWLPRQTAYRLGKALDQHMKAQPAVMQIGHCLDEHISLDNNQPTYQLHLTSGQVRSFPWNQREDAIETAKQRGGVVMATYSTGDPDEMVADYTRRSIRGNRAFQYTAKAPPGYTPFKR